MRTPKIENFNRSAFLFLTFSKKQFIEVAI
jgi:hypothetical protein